jgi:hypothetical protein
MVTVGIPGGGHVVISQRFDVLCGLYTGQFAPTESFKNRLACAQIAGSELLVAGGFAAAGRHGTARFWRCISWAVFVHQHRVCLPWCRGGRIASPSACAIGGTAVSGSGC